MGKYKILLALVVLLFFGGVYAGTLKKPSLTPTVQVEQAPILTDKTIIAYADQLGIDKTLLAYTYPEFGDPGKACNWEPSLGCFYFSDNHWKITIKHQSLSEERSTLAYEYMHYIYYIKLTGGQKAEYSGYIMYVYDNNPGVNRYMQQLLFEGGVGSPIFMDEVQATTCTQVADYKIPQPLLDYCKTYLPNRSALPNIY